MERQLLSFALFVILLLCVGIMAAGIRSIYLHSKDAITRDRIGAKIMFLMSHVAIFCTALSASAYTTGIREVNYENVGHLTFVTLIYIGIGVSGYFFIGRRIFSESQS